MLCGNMAPVPRAHACFTRKSMFREMGPSTAVWEARFLRDKLGEDVPNGYRAVRSMGTPGDQPHRGICIFLQSSLTVENPRGGPVLLRGRRTASTGPPRRNTDLCGRTLASCFSLAVLGLGLMPGVSQANLSITLGNPGNLVTNNVGGSQQTSDVTAEGSILGAAHPNVLQVETDVELHIGGAGSATIIATSTGFTSFEITPTADFLGFTGLAINLDDVNGSVGDVNYLIQAYDQFGNVFEEENVPLANGNYNRSYVLPLDALQYITRLVIMHPVPE